MYGQCGERHEREKRGRERGNAGHEIAFRAERIIFLRPCRVIPNGESILGFNGDRRDEDTGVGVAVDLVREPHDVTREYWDFRHVDGVRPVTELADRGALEYDRLGRLPTSTRNFAGELREPPGEPFSSRLTRVFRCRCRVRS